MDPQMAPQMVLMLNLKMDLILLFKLFIYRIAKLQIIMEDVLLALMDFSQKTINVYRYPIYVMAIIFKQVLALRVNLAYLLILMALAEIKIVRPLAKISVNPANKDLRQMKMEYVYNLIPIVLHLLMEDANLVHQIFMQIELGNVNLYHLIASLQILKQEHVLSA